MLVLLLFKLLSFQELNILNEEEHFTDLGRILINLSIEPQYAKMIVYSVLLRCLDPILTIVCALSSPQCCKCIFYS